MESAPLATALSHARKAAAQSSENGWKQAAQEHDRAAHEYARAIKSTSDSEALRILSLLEKEHAKLAQIITTKNEQEHIVSSASDNKPWELQSSPRNVKAPEKLSPSKAKQTSALTAARLGSQIRDSSPSLARDMASRRGIPQPGRNPPSAAAQARARATSPEPHRRTGHTDVTKIPPSIMGSPTVRQASKTKRAAEDDDAFGKFYNNLTTGTMSKLSSVLAYAGLPLTPEDILTEPVKLDKSTVVASNEPDPKQIFSQAALNAIEDEHRQRGSQGRVFGPAESFYVVQTGGGTYSYADIAKAQQQQQPPPSPQRQMSAVDEEDEEVFVDARDMRDAPSPRLNRSVARVEARNGFGKDRTNEELELENVTLKQTLEQLATRLTEFETHAQDASMAALTQSMASLHNPSPDGSGARKAIVRVAAAHKSADHASLDRISKLEKQLEQTNEERQKYLNLATEQKKMIKQYHAKWEDLKKNAKQKDRLRKEKSDAEKGNEKAITTVSSPTTPLAAAEHLVSANEPWKTES